MSGTGGEAVLFEVDEAPEPPRRKVPAGSAKTFRHDDQYQPFLLPPSLDDWLPARGPRRPLHLRGGPRAARSVLHDQQRQSRRRRGRRGAGASASRRRDARPLAGGRGEVPARDRLVGRRQVLRQASPSRVRAHWGGEVSGCRWPTVPRCCLLTLVVGHWPPVVPGSGMVGRGFPASMSAVGQPVGCASGSVLRRHDVGGARCEVAWALGLVDLEPVGEPERVGLRSRRRSLSPGACSAGRPGEPFRRRRRPARPRRGRR